LTNILNTKFRGVVWLSSVNKIWFAEILDYWYFNLKKINSVL